jgi:CheY-like chemotaxis protein
VGDARDRFGSCETCQKHERLTFARHEASKEYKWLCWNCRIASSGRWSAVSLNNVDRQQEDVLREDHQERLSSGKIRVSQLPPPGQPVGPVLVVEDNASLQDIICSVLEHEGFPTARAGNGKEALALIHKLSPLPRLILLDLLMPAMNGFEFYEQISRDRALSKIPVVVMTAHDSAQIGSLTLLHKPLRLETLLATVAEICAA